MIFHSASSKGTRFVEDSFGNPQFTDIVEQGTPPEMDQFLFRDAHRVGLI
jgi:hypothetical protein